MQLLINHKSTTLLLYSVMFLAVSASLPLQASLLNHLKDIGQSHPGKSGVYILEKGEESLLARAWLTDASQESIDIQYFIWSTDNIGTLASESLLRAAQRGVKVRVIVDDLLIDAEPETLLSLNAHPNIQIKIYNPLHSVGRGVISQLWHLITDFRGSNQRMHDKIVIYDQTIAITGGRNMADEYYDYDQTYNFRDRDVLTTGTVLDNMQQSFEHFWQSPLSVSLARLLKEEKSRLTAEQVEDYTEWLHRYASNPLNFAPEVRLAITNMAPRIEEIFTLLHWTEVDYIHDIPGKNNQHTTLSGGGQTTTSLIELLLKAEEEILIESPYLVMPEGGFEFFSQLLQKGVKISIVTNSLASTDNLQAYSGYQKQKQRLLDLGLNIYEFKPNPGNYRQLIERHEQLGKSAPVFALHAKSMVIDNHYAYIGTFNFDPRSTHLNTEVGVIIDDSNVAQQLSQAIRLDMQPENSWHASDTIDQQQAGFIKRLKVDLWSLLPLDPVL